MKVVERKETRGRKRKMSISDERVIRVLTENYGDVRMSAKELRVSYGYLSSLIFQIRKKGKFVPPIKRVPKVAKGTPKFTKSGEGIRFSSRTFWVGKFFDEMGMTVQQVVQRRKRVFAGTGVVGVSAR